ncbi:MAG: DUF1365 domain-containing protein [Desulfobacteraceae bacterium]|jgi:hypothetical protein
MKSAIYVGTISHQRHIPKHHRFSYHFYMWFFNLDRLSKLPPLGRWFSTRKWALSRFHRPDYLGDPEIPLDLSIRRRMKALTGHTVTGQVFGLMNMRTFGLYFSPVNFYYGFSDTGTFTHFLAEVSNIPWNERYQYAHHVAGNTLTPMHQKEFHVSPFNPIKQYYRWRIRPPGKDIWVKLEVHDKRGHIFTADLKLKRHPLTLASVKRQLLKKPVMTAFIVGGIYWQAFRLFLKGVPYVPYQKESQ